MTKRNLFFFPATAILITSIQAVRLFFAQPSPYSFTGINAVIPGLISFCMLSYFAFIVREKYWRVGITFGGIAFIARSCITGYPEQKLVFVVLTLALNLLSIAFLSASWRSLGADSTLGDQNQSGQGIKTKTAFVVLLMIVIVGIFLFWRRG
jgi:hypothetical protein